ncbi:aryl-sulfate sulfotransferase [candidate division KSB1 bacterium]|nr:aryl-sulfate sulfotransferase [candidate division KSB1 bacterium]
MKALALFILIILQVPALSTQLISIQPGPGSLYNSTQTGLLFKFDSKLIAGKDNFRLSVCGERSGLHDGHAEMYGNTLYFTPTDRFATDEKVYVTVYRAGRQISHYSFSTGSVDFYDPDIIRQDSEAQPATGESSGSGLKKPTGDVREINGVSVPYDFPELEVTINETGNLPGQLFLSNWIGRPYLLIYEKDGTPYFYKRLSDHVRDFKLQPTGFMTYRYRTELDVVSYIVLDSTYSAIDTLQCVNGYETDQHELTFTPDGHYFLIALGYHREDMSRYIAGGKKNALLIDNHIQEFDEKGRLVFEWKCNDHFRARDAVHENLKDARIDYIHINSIDVDYDDNIIICSRHQSEVTKIDRQTGQTIWCLGGVNNEFTFLNDEYGFSYPHDARAVAGKPNHYTLFDNGNYHEPPFSRGVEYKIDPMNYTATVVWEYRADPDRFAYRMGNVQRLANGNSHINWADQGLPKFTEVTTYGQIVYEADLEQSEECYRSFQFQWQNVLSKPSLIVDAMPDKVTCVYNKFGDQNVQNYIIYKGKTRTGLVPSDTTTKTFFNYTDLENYTDYYFCVQAVDSLGCKSDFSDTVFTEVKYVPRGENLIVNGGFDDGKQDWEILINDTSVRVSSYINGKGEYQIDLFQPSQFISDIQLIQREIGLVEGHNYLLEFDAYAYDSRVIEARLMSAVSPNVDYSRIGPSYLTTKQKHFSYDFTMTKPTDYSANMIINCARYATDFCLDNISLVEIVDSSVAQNGENRPTRFVLNQNYPNPYNPKTTISFEVPEISRVSIGVYDVLGKRVAKVTDLAYQAGEHRIPFDASDLASGVYFYRMEAKCIKSKKEFVQVKKMMVVK